MALKISYLLAQYLYTHKRLDLPGIGTFLLDHSVIIDAEHNKHRPGIPEGISFKNDPSIRDSPELVNYISTKAGKMKVLAESDLESHLQMALQFLNINKPFSFEGIGTLIKVKPGEYEFTQGNILSDKSKDHFEKEKHGLSKKETIEDKYQAFLATPVVKSRWRKPVIFLLVLAGIGLAIWGGYTISTNRDGNNEANVPETPADQTKIVPDSSQLKKPDSTPIIKKTNIPADQYKYVLEVAKANRAFRRYKQLKTNEWDVKMETKDSVQYKLFIYLPVTRDTTWKKDSLTAWLGRKVYIEHQN
ncbi:MAG: hypothetical protein Q8941_05405 [Bacteroidota bacterium]|nr:hypothetical protein [Bacteroidota bacterium]